MEKIGLVVNYLKKNVKDVLLDIEEKGRQKGLCLISDKKTVDLCNGYIRHSQDIYKESDILLVVGGDGTMLSAVRNLKNKNIPVMGINVGHLGFLTSASESEVDVVLDSLKKKNYFVSNRSVIKCAVERNGKEINSFTALNDVVLTHDAPARIITLDVSVNDDLGTSYVCDGLIVFTPSGSTGHSLSAGGPIIMPGTKALGLSIICPHALTSRPLVVPDNSHFAITVSRCGGNVLLTVDGQMGEKLLIGDIIHVYSGDCKIKLLQLPGYSYFKVLRHKLQWSGSSLLKTES